jgi:pimeloyl-ACP methyl ester carboxylesterase
MTRDPRSHGGAALALLLALALGACHRNVPGREVRWKSGGVELVGTLALPERQGPHPLVIFVPGSGCWPHPRAHEMVREHVKHLREWGVAAFVYDKRGCGESQGDWRDVGLEALADDLLAVLGDLVGDPAIDRDRVGLMGLSQGAWVSLIAAGKSAEIDFVVTLSGPPMTPAEQGHAIVEARMRAAGWDDASIDRALTIDRAITQVFRTDSGWDAARAMVEQAASEPWFADAGIGMQPRDSWNWRWLRSFMDYDPVPALRDLEVPILAVFGERDPIVPAARSQRIINELTPLARGARETRVIQGVGHELRAGKGESWPQAYWDALEGWLGARGARGPRDEGTEGLRD